MNPDFRKTLHFRLQENYTFPARYTFKFIVPSEQEKIDFLCALFPPDQVQVSLKTSAKQNFTSITIRATMPSAEAILEKYEAAAVVPGIISL
ncbi:MAG: DUF493 family protein [Bernardetiaceae bacterium]